MRRWAWALGRLCAAVGLAVVLAPGPKGWDLLLAVNDVDTILKMPGARSEYADISMSPSRYSIASILGHDIAAAYMRNDSPSDQTGMQRALIDGHGPDAAQAIAPGVGRSCEIMASAQAFDKDDSIVGLLSRAMPSRRLAWDYVLLHEAGHCNWNVALLAEGRLKAAGAVGDTVYQMDEYRLAKHVGEAYADAYSVMMLYRHDAALAAEMARTIANWRGGTNPIGSTHRTFASIACAAAMSQDLGAGVGDVEFASLHQRAVSCALRGAAYWMGEQGLSTDEQGRRLSWLDGLLALPDTRRSEAAGRTLH